MNPFQNLISRLTPTFRRRGNLSDVAEAMTRLDYAQLQAGFTTLDGQNAMDSALYGTASGYGLAQIRRLFKRSGTGQAVVKRMKTFIYEQGFTLDIKFLPGYPEDVASRIRTRVFDEFWDSEDTQIMERIEMLVMAKLLDGEHGWITGVNPYTGEVSLGDLSRRQVRSLETNPLDTLSLGRVIVDANGKDHPLRVIAPIADTNSRFWRYLDGDVFYWRNLQLPDETRGESELTAILEDLLQDKRFRRESIHKVLASLTWFLDVELKGYSLSQILEYAKKQREAPKTGSVRYRNDKMSYKWEAPNMQAAEIAELLKLLRGSILGQKGMPASWGGFGDDANLATATAQQYPIFADLTNAQAGLIKDLKRVVQFVVDRAIASGWASVQTHFTHVPENGIPVQKRLRDGVMIEVQPITLPREQKEGPLMTTSRAMDTIVKDSLAERPMLSTQDKYALLNFALQKDDAGITVSMPEDDGDKAPEGMTELPAHVTEAVKLYGKMPVRM